MERDKKNHEELLLDFHLDQLGDENRAWIERELLRDVTLRAKSDRLGEILRPLDHWTVGPAPSNLADGILRSVEQSSDGSPANMAVARMGGMAERRAAMGEAPEAHAGAIGSGRLPRPLFRLRELVAIAASIILLVTVFGPGLSKMRSRSRRTMCASNLGSVFRGVTMYQQAFDGSLPFAGSVPGAAWLPGGAGKRPFASNSRHSFLIAKLSFAKPEAFVCPSCKTGRPMRADELADFDDFARACNMSYASLNLSGVRPNLRPPTPIPYMSDPNPLFANARFNPSMDPAKANSWAHGRGAGQSVLILDGSVRWMTSPIYGTQRDNVWLAGEIRSYTGMETQTRKDDAFLIPGYPRNEPRKPERPMQ